MIAPSDQYPFFLARFNASLSMFDESSLISRINRNEDVTVDSLFAQGFDAVFIGTGLGKPRTLEIPIYQNGRCISEGENVKHCSDLIGVRFAIHFLRRVELIAEGFMSPNETHVHKGSRVWVIGGGNTAMDASRARGGLAGRCNLQ